METDEIDDLTKELAVIEARRAAFERAPVTFAFWDVTRKLLGVAFWLSFWLILAQCTCNGCMTEGLLK